MTDGRPSTPPPGSGGDDLRDEPHGRSYYRNHLDLRAKFAFYYPPPLPRPVNADAIKKGTTPLRLPRTPGPIDFLSNAEGANHDARWV